MTRRQNMWTEPNGRQYALQLLTRGADDVRLEAIAHGEQELFDVAQAMHAKEPVPAFLPLSAVRHVTTDQATDR